MNVSKELLSEVLGVNVKDIYKLGSNPNNECCCEHCLSNKCKEWAYERDFYIYSIFTFAGEGACYVTKDNEVQKRLATFAGDSEPEAVFAATQWLLDNKDKQ